MEDRPFSLISGDARESPLAYVGPMHAADIAQQAEKVEGLILQLRQARRELERLLALHSGHLPASQRPAVPDRPHGRVAVVERQMFGLRPEDCEVRRHVVQVVPVPVMDDRTGRQ
jgi:hypothetical protein